MTAGGDGGPDLVLGPMLRAVGGGRPRRWPVPGDGFPPSVLRTRCPDRPVRLAFGSCRAAGDVAQPDPAQPDPAQPDPAQPDPAHVDALAGTAVARLAGAARPAISWHVTQ